MNPVFMDSSHVRIPVGHIGVVNIEQQRTLVLAAPNDKFYGLETGVLLQPHDFCAVMVWTMEFYAWIVGEEKAALAQAMLVEYS